MALEAIIPHMLSNNTPPPFNVYASNQLASYAAFHAFRDDLSGWISDVVNSHIQVDLGRPYDIQRIYIDSETNLSSAKMEEFTLHGSNDGSTWVIVYSGKTFGYKYDVAKEFGTYRYLRITPTKMTSRGGSIRYFQVYKDDFGAAIVLKQDTIWVENNDVIIDGDVYLDDGREVFISSEINGMEIDAPVLISENGHVDFGFEAHQFNIGGNTIDIVLTNEFGVIKKKQFIVYKMSNLRGRKIQQSFPINIHTTPFDVFYNDKIVNSYPMRYLLYGNASGGVLKYKPYDRIQARIDEDVFYATNVGRNAIIEDKQDINSATRYNEKHKALLNEMIAGVRHDVFDAYAARKVSDAVRIRIALRELKVEWGKLLKDREGIYGEVELAMKRLKIAKNSIDAIDINAHRKNQLSDALAEFALDSNAFKKMMSSHDNDLFSLISHRIDIHDSLILELLNSESEIRQGFIDVVDLISYKNRPIGQIYEGYSNGHRVNQQSEGHFYTVYNAVTYESLGHINDGYFNGHVEKDFTGQLLEGYINADMKNPNVGHILETHNVDTKVEMLGYIGDDIQSVDKVTSKELIGSDLVVLTETLAVEGKSVELTDYVELLGNELYVSFIDRVGQILEVQAKIFDEDVIFMVEKFPETSLLITYDMYVNKLLKESRFTMEDTVYIEKMNKQAEVIIQDKLVNLMYQDVVMFSEIVYVDKFAKDSMIDFSLISGNEGETITKVPKEIFEQRLSIWTEKIYKNSYDIQDSYPVNSKADLIPIEANWFDFIDYADTISRGNVHIEQGVRYADKIAKEIWLESLIHSIDKVDKTSLVVKNFEHFMRKNPELYIYQEHGVQALKSETIGHKPGGDGTPPDEDHPGRRSGDESKLAVKAELNGHIMETLIANEVPLDGYIYEMVHDIIRDDEVQAIKYFDKIGAKQEIKAVINDVIERASREEYKPAKLETGYILVSGDSDWEDIFNRYSPGVDILDPPDADYDYSTLAARVYDPATGVPYAPVGATNEAKCVVETPLHHPIPQHNTVGVDDTKRIAVDNFIFIDCLLALETIKNKDVLRFAGMNASKTIQEVFSSLYLWIQGAAPGHEEYERMFRFMRWYAEAVVFRHTKQILIREYSSWRSSLHSGNDLGTPYSATGWSYQAGYNALKTTSLSGAFTFDKENYIDGKVIVRGYFDNPSLSGTMEITMDGVVVGVIANNGPFTYEFDAPQGNHTYRFSFMGLSGSVAISSIEISGSVFMSAHTVTDDSDSNGLKALNALMSQLLGYFDLHHGDGKIKGTMEVRQRAVWNTHT